MHGRRPALQEFAFHAHPYWLDDVAGVIKEEPWGQNKKALDLYLRANFEIAQAQARVYENKEKNVAFWRAGTLVSQAADPVWLVYRKNNREHPYWSFLRPQVGGAPLGLPTEDFTIQYEIPDYNSNWVISFDQRSLDHILREARNKARLVTVFGPALGGKFNETLVFKALYGEIQLKHKEGVVIPQWYDEEYQFLMPLYLTQERKVELTATLRPNKNMRRYEVRTLLFPNYSYAYARALVRSRAQFADWMLLDEAELSQPEPDSEGDDED